MDGEQDLRRYGGLRSLMPITAEVVIGLVLVVAIMLRRSRSNSVDLQIVGV